MFRQGKNIIVVYGENHNMIGVADSYKAAVDCVRSWWGGRIEIYDKELDEFRRVTIDEEKEIYAYGISKFNEFFSDSGFYLEVQKLWTAER